jgi:hypothetical protein
VKNIDRLFEDAEDHPLWRATELMAKAPPGPAEGYVTYALAWQARVRPLVRSVEQLLVLQLIYRRCLLARSRTVTLPNSELETLGIHRRTKYRALDWLNKVGLVSVESSNGWAPRVTLLDFP